MSENGQATIMASVVGAVAAGTPIIAGIVLTTDNVSASVTFVVALLVGLISIGTGVGKLYTRFKAQLEASIRRDELLTDLVRRIDRIEHRQIEIQRRLDSRP